VIGAGGVGCAAISLARTLIDTKLIVADISSTHRQAARNAGADAVVDPRDDDVTKKIRKLTGGEVAAIVDFVGSEESTGLAVNVLSQGGELVVVGLFGGILKLRLPLLPLKQLTVRGSYVGSLEEMASLIALVRTGNVTPIPLIARGLDDVQVALNDLADGQEVGRIVLKPHG
jgi:D-arabinose 1-dehydrogenase-like Zn-dependent alcohol dehydrogenase